MEKLFKRTRRAIAVMLAVIVAGSLCACGGGGKKAASTDLKNCVFSYEEMNLPEAYDTVTFVKDGFYGVRYIYSDAPQTLPEAKEVEVNEVEVNEAEVNEVVDENGDVVATDVEGTEVGDMNLIDDGFAVDEVYVPQNFSVKITKFDFEGNAQGEFEKEFSGNTYLSYVTVDDNGIIYYAMEAYDESGEGRSTVTLHACDISGTEKWNVDLSAEFASEEYFYLGQLMVANTGDIVGACNSNSVVVISPDGKIKGKVSFDNANGDQFVQTKDGRIGMLCYGDENMYLQMVNLADVSAGEKVDLKFESYLYSYFSGNGIYDCILSTNTGLFYYNIGDEKPTMIMDFISSDIAYNNLHNVYMMDEETVYASAYSSEKEAQVFVKFTKVAPEDVVDRKELTLGCLWVEDSIRNRAIQFGKDHPEYRIRIIDYSEYDTEEDYNAGMKQLNNDIVAGRCPDIIVCNSSMPLDSFMAKGVFTDLTGYIDSGEYSKDDFLPNVLDALSFDGKVYQIGANFYINTVVGKKSVVGDKEGWTLDELKAVMDKQPEGTVAFSEMPASQLVSMAVMMNQDAYINWETGECSFDKKEFLDILEYAKTYPLEIDYEAIYDDESYWENYETMFRENRTLLSQYTFASFTDFNYCEQGMFGEEVSMIGFPSDGQPGNGSAIAMDGSYAISDRCKDKDMAWEFVKYFISDAYYAENEYGFPIRKSVLEQRIETASKRPFYYDENGEKVEYDDVYFVGGTEIKIEPMKKEKAKALVEKMERIENVLCYDAEISKILEEELAPYFEGQKGAQEVADIIQSRIGVYVKENR